MKKYLWIFIFLILIIGIIIFLFNNNVNTKSRDIYIAKRTSTEKIKNGITNNQINDSNNIEETSEEELSSFSTKLPKDTKARYSNIELACNTLNGTLIKAGETFSLWDVLGNPNKENGYKKAKTFTSNGKVKKSYGGGICQVSTTIYNAVLKVEGLEIIERHEHSRDVVYIEDGKDAAVSYKTADFRFKNTLEFDVKIQAKLEDNKVQIKLMRI